MGSERASLRPPEPARFSLHGSFWRKWAQRGAHGPEWFARFVPPLIGLSVCALAGEQRRAIKRNLRRLRGKRPAAREALDVARTFATYASCLTEVLRGETRARATQAVIWGEGHVDDALSDGRGVLFVTAHTAGWEALGPVLWRDRELRVLIAASAEDDLEARAIQEEARREQGLIVAHVGADPLSALPLMRHLQRGGVVALQIDRAPKRSRAREVRFLHGYARFPEGPLRLSALTGAPIVPIFSARLGYRHYKIVASPPIRLARAASDEQMSAAAQTAAAALECFVLEHPTHWFHFQADA
jgi:KDO2-lipid IV(A) lauroyltransferase